MSSLFAFLKKYTLPLAMLLGVLGYPWFRHLSFLLPTLIFFMLFFTFCKVNPLDLRLHRWHWILLLVQIACSFAAYYLLLPFDHILAQGLMLCFIMPTATAAPIIAGKLGGSIQSLTSYTLLSNVATAILVPAFFPLVNPAADLSFLRASSLILYKVTPLLLGPFFAAWLLRLCYNARQHMLHSERTFHISTFWASMPFYLWALSLVILMAQITWSLLHEGCEIWMLVAQSIGALIACLVQFFTGKLIGQTFPSVPHGEDYHDILVSDSVATDDLSQITRISAGQAFGQKNTTLGIWMAHTYLNPLSALATAAYIIWQNVFNAWQLARAADGKKV